MHAEEKLTAETFPAAPERATLEGKNKFLGFWLFLGGETVLFASLFATYLALKDKTNGGPSAEELFQMPVVFMATMLLLTSSLTSVYAIYHMKNFDFKRCSSGLALPFCLAPVFWALKFTSSMNMCMKAISLRPALSLQRSTRSLARTEATSRSGCFGF